MLEYAYWKDSFDADGQLYVSGIDIVDQTPIIDIKPYIEKYDYPFLGVEKVSPKSVRI